MTSLHRTLFAFLALFMPGAALTGPIAICRGQEEKKGDAKEVPLNLIYSTSPQKGLKRVTAEFIPGPKGRKTYKEVHGPELEEILLNLRSGASDVYLTSAADLTAAIRSAKLVFTWNASLDPPPLREKQLNAQKNKEVKRETYWLVAHLGMGTSENPTWLVKSVSVTNTTVKLSYSTESKSRNQSKGKLPYLFWVPLGELSAGPYSVELLDIDQKEVSLRRLDLVQ